MKDIIEFPVVGTRYTPGMLLIDSFQEGMILELEAEPDNQFDQYAIKVVYNNTHIGYVPNKGLSCSHCWSYVSRLDTCCPQCGAGWDFVVGGGLAVRLLKTKSLKKGLACYVKSVDNTNKFSPITAKLILE